MSVPDTQPGAPAGFDGERDHVGAASTDARVVAVLDVLRDKIADGVAQALIETRALHVDEPEELVDLQLIEVELHRTKGDESQVLPASRNARRRGSREPRPVRAARPGGLDTRA
jgi:hypothetical protein